MLPFMLLAIEQNDVHVHSRMKRLLEPQLHLQQTKKGRPSRKAAFSLENNVLPDSFYSLMSFRDTDVKEGV
jgi:hypothetical protein